MNNKYPNGRIPKKSFNELFLVSDVEYNTLFELIQILYPNAIGGNISLQELITLNLFCVLKNPMMIIEFGTFNGRTTLNLAANTNTKAKIVTVDLPKEKLNNTKQPLEHNQNFDDIDETGYVGLTHKLYLNFDEYAKNIKQIWCDSADFISLYPDYLQTADMVFVDASHSFENALNDSLSAKKLIKPGGWIFWHDYDGWPGVTEALNCIYDTIEIDSMFQIEETSIVCYNSSKSEE